ncbi:GNAT family N-acetyltransferase [Streptomyces sp. URMC 126]|uniref:GNAT family N-acetyltransferase n=1 Tax=Streptomyces sp. URMC 126 TaxID=3423401 RepID=UPI003F1AF7B7
MNLPNAPGVPPCPAWEHGVLRTERLELTPLRVEHAEEMAGVLADPALYGFTGGTPDSADALRERYRRLVAGSPDPLTVWHNRVLRLRDGGRLVGTVQATVTASGSAAEVAWVVGVPWQGRGLATEAAREWIAWLTGRGARTIIAHIHPGHRASAAVAAACGLAPTGERQDGEIRWRLSASSDQASSTYHCRTDLPRT